MSLTKVNGSVADIKTTDIKLESSPATPLEERLDGIDQTVGGIAQSVADLSVADVYLDPNASPRVTLESSLNTDYVHMTGNETVAGQKTFSDTTKFSSDIVFDKASGEGIKVDLVSPTFTWKDILGKITPHEGGGLAPAWSNYVGNIKQYQFDVNDEVYVEFHIPHDYVPGTDLFIHVHWSHKTTVGTATWLIEATYASGHGDGIFNDPSIQVTASETSASLLQHMVSEVQLSIPDGLNSSPALLDSNDIEVDGVILVRLKLQSNTGAGVFAHFCDVHYQSTGIGTKQKAPDFYT